MENMDYLKYFGRVVTNHARWTTQIKSRIAKATAVFNKNSLHQKIGIKFKEETSEMLRLEQSCARWLKLGHFGKYIRNTMKA